MAVKTYQVNDFWLDIDKENHVDIESTDGVITSVKNNGEDIGGGGSSDFSTAEVTVVNTANPENTMFPLPVANEATEALPASIAVEIIALPSGTYIVPLYKGRCDVSILTSDAVTCSGNATVDGDIITITGDCTITIS